MADDGDALAVAEPLAGGLRLAEHRLGGIEILAVPRDEGEIRERHRGAGVVAEPAPDRDALLEERTRLLRPASELEDAAQRVERGGDRRFVTE